MIMLMPLGGIAAVSVYLFFFTNLPPLLYLYSIRNIYFDCMEFVQDDYVYKMKPGECKLSNIEFDTTMTHDADGFRNLRQALTYDVVAIGDSHTHGWGVGDDQTFSSILASEFGYASRNLGIGSYATMRELEVLSQYGSNAKYVVIQYCNNDFGENLASLRLSKQEFRSEVESEWKARIRDYEQGKSLGYKKPIHDLAGRLASGSFESLSTWRRSAAARNMEHEAAAFAQIIARYRQLLTGKKLIIFESADSGLNTPRFVETFASELNKIDWLRHRLLDTASILTFDDYYFLDGHPNQAGHRKLAARIANEIASWENTDRRIKR